MSKRALGLALIGILLIGLTVIGQGMLSGYASLETRFDLAGPDPIDVLDFDMGVTYSIGELSFSSDTLIVLPGMWVWQGFSGGGAVSAFSVETNVLFSGYLAEHLYTEVIVGLPIGGIDFTFHAAQLGDAVLGGPHDGWAVRIAGSVGILEVVSITEFGAQIDGGGITIVHAPTGRERHYATDPRAMGKGFTGEKVAITGFPFCCADIDIAAYLTCANGFEYVGLGVTGIEIEKLEWLTLEADLTFTVEDKTLAMIPTLDIGEVFCFTLFSALDFSGGMLAPLSIDGVKFMGLELSCKIGPVTIRDVTLLDHCNLGLTTEEYGSLVMAIDDILDLGYEYYRDYWEMLSIAYAGPDCCEGESTVVVNLYFERNGAQLFDLAAVYLEANIPVGNMLTLSIGTRTTFPDIDWIKFAFDVVF